MNVNHKKTITRNLTITSLILAGMLVTPTLVYAEQVNHSYDDLNRLIKSDYSNGNVIDYAYDAAGNRTTQKVTAATNQLPIANAGPNQTVHLGSLVMLDGSASTDPTPGTSPLSYLWSQIQGSKVTLNGPNTVKPTFKPILPGAYKFSLKVKDGIITSLPATVSITVEDVPIVVFSPNGGEVWKVNTSKTISWYTSKALVDIHNPVSIKFSDDGGDHWKIIEKETRNIGTYRWKPHKHDVTNQALISVCLLNHKKEKSHHDYDYDHGYDDKGGDREDHNGHKKDSGICDGSDANFKIIK